MEWRCTYERSNSRGHCRFSAKSSIGRTFILVKGLSGIFSCSNSGCYPWLTSQDVFLQAIRYPIHNSKQIEIDLFPYQNKRDENPPLARKLMELFSVESVNLIRKKNSIFEETILLEYHHSFSICLLHPIPFLRDFRSSCFV